MKAIGPRLPLSKDSTFGFFSLIDEYKEEIKQNLKNLVLTSPGERVMNPDFGVGLRRFLFDPREKTISGVRQRLESQVRKYMPFVRIIKVQFDAGTDGLYLDNSNILSIKIIYDVPSINLSTSLLLQREEIN